MTARARLRAAAPVRSLAAVADFRPHQTVRILSGQLEGLVGIVHGTTAARVLVDVQGVKDGETVDVRARPFDPKALEVLS